MIILIKINIILINLYKNLVTKHDIDDKEFKKEYMEENEKIEKTQSEFFSRGDSSYVDSELIDKSEINESPIKIEDEDEEEK